MEDSLTQEIETKKQLLEVLKKQGQTVKTRIKQMERLIKLLEDQKKELELNG